MGGLPPTFVSMKIVRCKNLLLNACAMVISHVVYACPLLLTIVIHSINISKGKGSLQVAF